MNGKCRLSEHKWQKLAVMGHSSCRILSKYHLLPCINALVDFLEGVEGESLRVRDSIVIENICFNVTVDVRELLDSDTAFRCWN